MMFARRTREQNPPFGKGYRNNMVKPGIIIRSYPSFDKAIKKYKQFWPDIDKKVEELQQNPYGGEPILAKSCKGMRHAKIGRNWVIWYVYCREAKEKRKDQMRAGKFCPYCGEKCQDIDGETIMLLYFSSHGDLDNIRG
jgi:hypothetical protein